jgi:hypothetical protein
LVLRDKTSFWIDWPDLIELMLLSILESILVCYAYNFTTLPELPLVTVDKSFWVWVMLFYKTNKLF